jgi:hypothetical protein
MDISSSLYGHKLSDYILLKQIAFRLLKTIKLGVTQLILQINALIFIVVKSTKLPYCTFSFF